ncbi:MAG: hypothetical protein ABI231_07330 [Candidatus Tumulicola sp.]
MSLTALFQVVSPFMILGFVATYKGTLPARVDRSGVAAKQNAKLTVRTLSIGDFFRHWTRAQSSGMVVGESAIVKSGSADGITAAYMVAANHMLGLSSSFNMPAHLRGATTTPGISRVVVAQTERAAAWMNEHYPTGLTLYRGLNPQQVQAAMDMRLGGALALSPLTAATSKAEVAKVFATLSSPDLFTLGVSSRFLNVYLAELSGVRSGDVFSSKRQEGRSFPGTKTDDEWIILGTARDWEHVGSFKETVGAVVVHTLKFKPRIHMAPTEASAP